MKKSNTKKLALAGVLCAVAVVGSMFSFPVFGSKCAPVQHMVNVLCAVLLGPWYGAAAAGIGVFTVNGKMVDVAFIPGAERTLKLAKACGMYEGDLV